MDREVVCTAVEVILVGLPGWELQTVAMRSLTSPVGVVFPVTAGEGSLRTGPTKSGWG